MVNVHHITTSCSDGQQLPRGPGGVDATVFFAHFYGIHNVDQSGYTPTELHVDPAMTHRGSWGAAIWADDAIWGAMKRPVVFRNSTSPLSLIKPLLISINQYKPLYTIIKHYSPSLVVNHHWLIVHQIKTNKINW